jgi:hypothetical protein
MTTTHPCEFLVRSLMITLNYEPWIRSTLAREEQEDSEPLPSARFDAIEHEFILLARLPPLSRIESDARLAAKKSRLRARQKNSRSQSIGSTTQTGAVTTASDPIQAQGQISTSTTKSSGDVVAATPKKEIQPYEVLRAIE